MSTPNLKNFAERVRSRRKSLRLSLKEVANHVGISVSAVAAWERGENFPRREMEDKLAEILQTSPQWLLGKSEGDLIAEDTVPYKTQSLIEPEDERSLLALSRTTSIPRDHLIRMAVAFFLDTVEQTGSIPLPRRERTNPSFPDLAVQAAEIAAAGPSEEQPAGPPGRIDKDHQP